MSVVITYKENPATLVRCLEAVYNQTVKPSEIILNRGNGVKTESEDASEGFLKSESDYIFTTNADCYLPPRFVEWGEWWLDNCPEVSIVSGVRKHPEGPARAFDAKLSNGPITKMAPGLGVSGSCMGFRKEILDGILPFKFRTGWDTELALRTKGRIIIDPGIVVYHDHRISSRTELYEKSKAYSQRARAMTRAFGWEKIGFPFGILSREGSTLDNLTYAAGQVRGFL